MSTDVVPTREELVKRIAEIESVLRANTEWSVENRQLHEDTLKALTDAGLFRIRLPRRYGGYESDTRTMVQVASELGRIDGSAAWVLACSWIATWAVGMFSDEVQDAVFADPNVQASTTIGPGTAIAVPAEGGIVVNGSWPAISGAHSSRYQVIVAIFLDPAGEPYPVMSPVRLDELKIDDNWFTSGFRATGSVSTSAEQVFIPDGWYRPAFAVASSQAASEHNAELAMYQPPFMMASAAAIVGICVGMAKAVQEVFFERLPGRKITYTSYEHQSEAPVTHLRVAEASLKIDEAEFHAYRVADLIDRKSASGEPWEMAERARCRADVGAAMRLSLEAADIFAAASGGSSAYTDVPIQRIVSDMRAHGLHALMTPDVNYELYGRVLCGLEPNSLFL